MPRSSERSPRPGTGPPPKATPSCTDQAFSKAQGNNQWGMRAQRPISGPRSTSERVYVSSGGKMLLIFCRPQIPQTMPIACTTQVWGTYMALVAGTPSAGQVAPQTSAISKGPGLQPLHLDPKATGKQCSGIPTLLAFSTTLAEPGGWGLNLKSQVGTERHQQNLGWMGRLLAGLGGSCSQDKGASAEM